MRFDDAIDRFLRDALQRVEASTVGHYEKRLNSFRRDLGHREVASLTEAELREHIARQGKRSDGTDKAPDTIRSMIVAWSQLQKWLVETEAISKPIVGLIKKPGGRKRDWHFQL